MSFFSRDNKPDNTKTRGNEFSSGNPLVGTMRFSVFGNTAVAMKQGTVYRIVNMISDTIASLPLIPYNIVKEWKYLDNKSNLYNLFNVEPNPYMSAFTFKKYLVTSLLLKGNAFIVIDRDKKTAEVNQLTLLIADLVLIEYEDNDIKYKDMLSGAIYDKSQVIHIMNYGSMLYKGESTISYMMNCLNVGQSLDNYILSLSSSGMQVTGLLKPVAGSGTSPDKAQKAKDSFNTATSNLQANSVIVLDNGFDFQQISISPKDAKYLESSKLNQEQICRFFGISPALVGITNSHYTTSEQLQLEYLTNTIQPIIQKIENELLRKIVLKPDWNSKKILFDTTNFLRLDAVAQANYLSILFGMGAQTTNEVRDKINAAYPATDGNQHFISTNLQPIDNLIVNMNNSVDNKLKNKNGTTTDSTTLTPIN